MNEGRAVRKARGAADACWTPRCGPFYRAVPGAVRGKGGSGAALGSPRGAGGAAASRCPWVRPGAELRRGVSAVLRGCGAERLRVCAGRAKLSCARGGRPRELSFSSSEDDDGVLEGLEEFFAEERVAAQKKKKCKKLKDCKAAKIKRRKKEVMLRALGQGWWVPASCAVEVGCPGHPAPAGTPGDGQLPRV